jgi:exodeoxyribonuclease III
MKLISWNVNGIRAAAKKGLTEFVDRERPDILCLQETKAHREQVEPELLTFGNTHISHWSSAVKKGYSGVATYIKIDSSAAIGGLGINSSRQVGEVRKPVDSENEKLSCSALPVVSIAKGIDIPEYDSEGRFVISDHKDFRLYNIYFPNGGARIERHELKQRFLRDLLVRLKKDLAEGRSVIVTGDYNVAHRDADVYDPEILKGESGFLPEEKSWMDEFLAAGFVDTYRHFFPSGQEKFTWWSYLERARLWNRGWRIDYFCVSKDLVPRLRRADILDGVEGSDHCPVLLEIE